MKKRFILLSLVVCLIVSSVPYKKVYAVPGVLEGIAAYKLVEGIIWTLGTGYLVKSGYETLKNDDQYYEWEEAARELDDSYFTPQNQVGMLQDINKEFKVIKFPGSDPDPDPDNDLRILLPPFDQEKIRDFLKMNDKEVVDYANQFYSQMAEHEKEKFLNNQPYKVNFDRSSIDRIEQALRKPLSKLVNPKKYIDQSILDVYSVDTGTHISAFDFPHKDEENIKKLTYFLNLAIQNKFDNIQYITLGNPDLNDVWSPDEYTPFTLLPNGNKSSTFIIATKGEPIVDFSNASIFNHGKGYLGYDISFKDVIFSDEVLVLGFFRLDKPGTFGELNVVQTRRLKIPFQLEHVSDDGVGYNAYIDFTVPSTLDIPTKNPVLVPDIFNKDLPILAEFPQTDSLEDMFQQMAQIFSPSEMLDLLLNPGIGEITVDEDDPEDEQEGKEPFVLPDIFDVNLKSIDGVEKEKKINFEPLNRAFAEVTNKFPFSLPWDLMGLVAILKADPVAPKFTFDFSKHENKLYKDMYLELDLSEFEEIAKIIRFFMLMIFVYVLIINTKLTKH